MFPLNWNFPFRKKDGSMVKLQDAMTSDVDALELRVDALEGDVGGLEDDVDGLQGDVGDLETALSGKFVLATRYRSMTLATANGTKTIETILAEAKATLLALTVPDGEAYEFRYLEAPIGDGSSSVMGFNIVANDVSPWDGTRTMQNMMGERIRYNPDIMSLYAVSLLATTPFIARRDINLANGTETNYPYATMKEYKPSDGTKVILHYNVWKVLE